MFISKERKLSEIKGTGVQYIPGHNEPLVDYTIEVILPECSGSILDLGGGGLRFSIPVAEKNRKINVVDLDPSGLDIVKIYSRIKENGYINLPEVNLLKKNISPIVDDVFNFLETSEDTYSLITAFRLIHFFNEEQIATFFSLVSNKLKKDGMIVISAMTPFEEDNKTFNEFYKSSKAINDHIFYRKFINTETTIKLQAEQNMGDFIHLFTEEYIAKIAMDYKLKLISGNLPSTRIVRGYVFTK